MRAPATLRSFAGTFELIHAEAGPALLRLARFGIFLLWIVKLLLDPVWRLGDLPPELIRPVGLLALVPADDFRFLWSGAGLTFLWVLTLMVLILGLTQRAFALVATAAAILLTIYSSAIRSFGPAVHTDIVLLLATYALALFAWVDGVEARSSRAAHPQPVSSAPLITIVALLTLTYCLVGLNRGIASSQVFTGNSMEVWTIDASLRAYYFNTGIGWQIPQWPLVVFLLKAGLPVITFFEITAPLCLVWPLYRRAFLPVMISFHLLSLVLMNIFFFDDLLLYLLLIDWSRRFPALRAPRPA
jgi:hypothetical protein